ncbi:MAG: formate dehydrogenase subunit alpha [Deltaproteobacteria bacterium]|nr:formate dehydrogenase subunit alpha [Deltaproteobacteria bacterium]MBW2069030.1 formate dehydrogenase subunit alpha [Deltaproteobacteria bacterium]
MKTGSKSKVICPFCGAGCAFFIVTKSNSLNIEYISDHPVALGALCPKGNSSISIVKHPDRLKHPLVKSENEWIELPWNDALNLAAERLLDIKKRYGADSVGFLASARATNEEIYLFQKLARLFGSPHIDHCARLCHAPSLVALKDMLGSGAMTNPISDLANSDCIFVLGSNFAETHPVVSRWVWDAKDRGAVVIVADPRRTITTRIADLHLQLRSGSDPYLLYAMMKVIVDRGLCDYQFVRERTEGFDDLYRWLHSFDLKEAVKFTGLSEREIVAAACYYAEAYSAALIYCMGITQHRNGTENVRACANLALLCGKVGAPGSGIFPLRGQNNVQGACDMGALADYLPGYADASNHMELKKLSRVWEKSDLPLGPGYTVTEMTNASLNGKIKAMVILGENPVVSDPEASGVKKALEKLEFLLVIDLFMTETARYADILLPAACWAEKEGSYTNTERRVQWSEKALDPDGDAKPDLWIIGELGKRLKIWGYTPRPDEILREINRVVPQYGGITPERLRLSKNGLIWPCQNESHPGTPILHQSGRFKFHTPQFAIEDKGKIGKNNIFKLITGRLVVHYNSGSMSRRLSELFPYEPIASVSINPEDAAALGLKNGDEVKLIGESGEGIFQIRLDVSVPPKTLFLPFHFPGVNDVVTVGLDTSSRTPGFKDAECRLEVV